MRIIMTLLALTLATLACSILSLPAATESAAPSEPSAAETAPEAAPRFERGDLYLEILTPTDEQVTNEASILVSGKAPAESILTINDEILLVGESGTFEVQIPLEIGANAIEIIASNYAGDELSATLTVFREE